MSIKKGSKIISGAPLEPVWGTISGDIADQADLQNLLSSKADVSSAELIGTPTAPTPPIGSYNNRIATTKFVSDSIGSAGIIPPQQGHGGEFLTTDGESASWGVVDSFPEQEGQSGKFLTTDGTSVSWSTIPNEIPSQSGQSGKYLTTNGSTVSWGSFDESDLVHKTGDESIGGTKTFTGDAIFTGEYGAIVLKDSSGNYSDIQFQESDGSRKGMIRAASATDANKLTLSVGNSSGTLSDGLTFYISNTDSTNTTATFTAKQVKLPTPTDDNTTSSQGDTVGARNTKLQSYQPLLVSGTNIKTVNGTTLLGSGDLDTFPSQTGNSGKFLTTNGTAVSWATVDALPTQAGQSGKFLTTDGTYASWSSIDDSNFVHKDGTETITGQKTFTNQRMYISSEVHYNGSGTPTDYAYGTKVDLYSNISMIGTLYTSGTFKKTTDGTNVLTWTLPQDKEGTIALTQDIPTVDQTYSGTSTNPQSGVAVKSAIDAAISSVYKPAGSVAFANRPSLSKSIEGNVYNITDAFTTTTDFVEGSGHSYPAGTNIVCINTSGTTYKWDVLAGFIDLSGYQPTITGGATTITSSDLTVSRALVSNSSGKVAVSDVTATELGYLDGVTSNVQTQLDGKVDVTGDTMTGNLQLSGAGIYLTSIGSTVAASTSRLNLGTPSNVYAYLTGNTSGAFGIYTELSGSRTGIACYPGQNFFADATTKTIDLGRSQSVWKTGYINSLSDGSNSITVADIVNKQDELVSGTNIKTINGNSILGSGNLAVDGLPSQSGQSGKYLTTNGTSASWTTAISSITYDSTTETLTFA